jgi:Fic family protein
MEPYIPDTLPLDSIDWAAHVSLIGQANAALARYDGMLQGIVNPRLFLSPLTTQEAVLSSRIEGTQASMEEVLEYEADPREEVEPSKYADIQEIINYRRAMGQAVESLEKRPLCLNLIKELHAILLDSVRGRNMAPGQFRRIQNYIAPPGSPIERATFVPPSPDRLLQALDNWEKYLHSEEKDGLVQLAVIKAQFEIIHPFLDGNGRLGRMLVPLFLFDKKLLSSPVFYLSAYLEAHWEVYFARLRAITQKHDWNGWIQFFLTAVVNQAIDNIDKVQEMLGLYGKMKSRMVEITHSQFAIQALDAIFSRPIFRGADFPTISGIPTKQTAAALVRQLIEAGILKVMQPAKGRRSAMLGFPELINLVEGRPVV